MVFNIETTFHPTFLPWNCKSNDLVEINDNRLPSTVIRWMWREGIMADEHILLIH